MGSKILQTKKYCKFWELGNHF